jgi:hypothetical protein
VGGFGAAHFVSEYIEADGIHFQPMSSLCARANGEVNLDALMVSIDISDVLFF